MAEGLESGVNNAPEDPEVFNFVCVLDHLCNWGCCSFYCRIPIGAFDSDVHQVGMAH